MTALEKISTPRTASRTLSFASSGVGPRYSSKAETLYLQKLVDKYGDNIDQMTKDHKLNSDQRTPVQLRNALRRAGLSTQWLYNKRFIMNSIAIMTNHIRYSWWRITYSASRSPHEPLIIKWLFSPVSFGTLNQKVMFKCSERNLVERTLSSIFSSFDVLTKWNILRF